MRIRRATRGVRDPTVSDKRQAAEAHGRLGRRLWGGIGGFLSLGHSPLLGRSYGCRSGVYGPPNGLACLGGGVGGAGIGVGASGTVAGGLWGSGGLLAAPQSGASASALAVVARGAAAKGVLVPGCWLGGHPPYYLRRCRGEGWRGWGKGVCYPLQNAPKQLLLILILLGKEIN